MWRKMRGLRGNAWESPERGSKQTLEYCGAIAREKICMQKWSATKRFCSNCRKYMVCAVLYNHIRANFLLDFKIKNCGALLEWERITLWSLMLWGQMVFMKWMVPEMPSRSSFYSKGTFEFLLVSTWSLRDIADPVTSGVFSPCGFQAPPPPSFFITTSELKISIAPSKLTVVICLLLLLFFFFWVFSEASGSSV